MLLWVGPDPLDLAVVAEVGVAPGHVCVLLGGEEDGRASPQLVVGMMSFVIEDLNAFQPLFALVVAGCHP